jgi:hypothetical protein
MRLTLHSELCLQRIEAQSPFALSRQVGTPNIAAKGKLLPRTVEIPTFLAQNQPTSKTERKVLIEDVTPTPAKEPQKEGFNPRGILKTAKPTSSTNSTNPGPASRPLAWTWNKSDATGDLTIVVNVPHMVCTICRLSAD